MRGMELRQTNLLKPSMFNNSKNPDCKLEISNKSEFDPLKFEN